VLIWNSPLIVQVSWKNPHTLQVSWKNSTYSTLYRCHEKIHIHYRGSWKNPLTVQVSWKTRTVTVSWKTPHTLQVSWKNPLTLQVSWKQSTCTTSVIAHLKSKPFLPALHRFFIFLWDGGWDRALIGKNWISCKWTFLSQMPVIFWSMRKGSVWRELTLSGQVHEFFIPFKMQWSQNQEACNRDRIVQIHEMCTRIFGDVCDAC